MLTNIPTMEHDYQLRNGMILDDAKQSQRVPIKLKAGSIQIGCATISVEAAQFILAKHKEHFESAKEVLL